MMAGISPRETVKLEAEVNGDEIIGMAEANFILQNISMVRLN